ncbi:uncharacterized protein LOC143040440 [Oratosquilla oratoria]|uniref:uncharacterized protein LOC143040440 n=1 Tax=Oratosquilla oratoria TaxID=337810 RepID=UPI003F776567
MTPGLSEDLQGISDARKTAVISSELLRLQVDIAALQETRIADSGTLKEKEFTFFWHGKSAEDRSEHGVGFAVRNTLLSMVEPGDKGSERLMTLRLHTSEGPVTLVSAYAPTLTSTAEAKDEFYINISNIINENGQRLLEFCSYNSLCVTNSFFQTKPQHRVSWCHPRSKHWHQLDLILIRRSNIKLVQITRTYHSADCDTDHSLVCCKIRLQPKKLHKSKQKGKPRMNTMGMHLPEKVEEFAKSLQKALSVEHQHCSAAEKWDHLRDTIQKTALATFGKKTSKNNDWFDAKFSEMSPVIDAKRAALAEYKRSPNEKTLQALRAVRSKVQQTARPLDAIEPLAIMEELDAEPTIAELYKAIDSLASGKAPGNDGIPPDLIKCCKNTLLQPLHDALCQCWKEGAVPQDMRDAKIVTLYKNKGERSDLVPQSLISCTIKHQVSPNTKAIRYDQIFKVYEILGMKCSGASVAFHANRSL